MSLVEGSHDFHREKNAGERSERTGSYIKFTKLLLKMCEAFEADGLFFRF